MKKSIRLLAAGVLLLAPGLITTNTKAQAPVCFGPGTGLLYYLDGGKIMQFDPAAPVSATNPIANNIALPVMGSGGLAVSTNLNGTGPSPTFYLVGNTGTNYMYWNGNTWVNTGHAWSAVNPCGAGPYIYSLNGGTGQVYRYDGTGNDVLVTTIASFTSGGPYDLAGDNCGNFYVLRMNTSSASGAYLHKYDPNGTLIQSWTVSGQTPINSGGGMGIIGNTVYCHNVTGFWVGTINGSNVSFSLMPGAPGMSPSDFGTCALGSFAGLPKASIDTGYYCGTGPGIPVSLAGGQPLNINWSVISGSATIYGSGNNITVTATTDAKILMNATAIDPCGGLGTVLGKDTVTIIVPTATLNAGNNFTSYGCGKYIDTINATLTNHKTWMQYNLDWTPASWVLAGANTLTPVINPKADMWFIVTATTNANQGGCAWTDSVRVTLVDAKAEGTFGCKINYGCTEDTVLLTDSSTSALGSLKHYWTLGENRATDSVKNPVYIYEKQSIYQIVMYINNEHCRDTVYRSIDLNHPIIALFDFTNGRICEGDIIDFDGTKSIVTFANPPIYSWYFGDGSTDNTAQPKHSYKDAGVYTATLIVTDSLNCTDTIAHTIDDIMPLPYIDLGPADTIICKGEPVYLPLGISARGEKWVWNDGSEQARKIASKPGRYIVRLYNECGFGTDSIDIDVKDCTVFFPSAFSPNGDGKNDLAKIIGNLLDVTKCEMSIFNRWGDRVCYTLNKDEGWDGTFKNEPQPMGTYFYRVKYTSHGEEYEMTGDIILIR